MISEVFREKIYNSFCGYFGKNINELAEHFLVDINSKNHLESIVNRILGYQGRANQSLELIRSNLVVKTIKLQPNGRIKESMSFPAFEFTKIISTKWKDSDLRALFLTQTFLFVIFSVRGNQIVLSQIKFWNMPLDTLENDVKSVWEKTVEVIKSGNVVSEIRTQSNGKTILKTNFPGISFNKVCHVRPHAQNANDAYYLPYPDKLTGMAKFTKQCFWLNSSFIQEIIEE